MKESLNKPERSQSQALYYKVKAAFQFSPQGQTGMTLTPALSRRTGEGRGEGHPHFTLRAELKGYFHFAIQSVRL
jgi:hypothetical protein